MYNPQLLKSEDKKNQGSNNKCDFMSQNIYYYSNISYKY